MATWKELSNTTWNEASQFTWDQLNRLEIDELIAIAEKTSTNVPEGANVNSLKRMLATIAATAIGNEVSSELSNVDWKGLLIDLILFLHSLGN